MEILGTLDNLSSTLGVLNDLRKAIQRLRQNPQRTEEFTREVDKLLGILGTAQQMSDDAEELVRSGVNEVKTTLNALAEEKAWVRKAFSTLRIRETAWVCKVFSKWVAAPGNADKLDDVQEKLKSLTTQVVVVNSIFQLKKERLRICNETLEIPECEVGLHRADEALQFLQTSQNLALRVMGIHGLPGVGKTTLFNLIWNKASSSAPFAAKAHVQIGLSIDDKGIGKLQSEILRQLGGENLKFTAPDGGKGQLSKHLQQLRNQKAPVYLGIDNVFAGEDLRRLLPNTISKDLPKSSVIVITCRVFSVVRDLLNLCKLDRRRDESQIFLLSPGYLNPEDSKKLFAEYGCLSDHEDADLLDNLVPLCGGFPLALTMLGRLFVDSRKREEWELIKEQMERFSADGSDTREVTKALQVTYNQLNEQCKAAFCEVVMCFYGWNWGRVERILGVSVLNDLKESCLISEAENWSRCNQSALREGYTVSWKELVSSKKVVIMHDLTLRFGEGVSASLLKHTTITESRAMRVAFQRLEASKLRHLIICTTDTVAHKITISILKILKQATNLQSLHLDSEEGFSVVKSVDKSVFTACSFKDVLSTGEQPSLHALKLTHWEGSRRIMEMKLSCEIREIHLRRCDDVEQLPSNISLRNLEVLQIVECGNFKHLPPSSVRECHNLKYLQLSYCHCLASVPAELGCRRKLCHLVIEKCETLEVLPTLSCPLQKLYLKEIPIANLELEEAAYLHLQEVYLRCGSLNASSVKTMLAAIGSVSSLQSLTVGADQLVELPENVGNLSAVTTLNLYGCKSLKKLPSTIGNGTSLQYLNLYDCEALVELPEGVGKLTALTKLNLGGCRSLKALPPNIGNVMSLQTLILKRCESLVELPEGVGKLTALTTLNLDGCRSLKSLPPNIGNVTSLQTLILSRCETLVEFPEGEVEKLTALTDLSFYSCNNLMVLPSDIGNVTSLIYLNLGECEALVELPEGVGNLTSLETLTLENCRNLKRLPTNIGNVTSLYELNLSKCESLVELPERVGNLTALTQLILKSCRNLKKLPQNIGNAKFLCELILSECESLVELPEGVGDLTALRYLSLKSCRNLKRLPSNIGNVTSLIHLNLSGCESLVELPEGVVNLTALKDLDLSRCKNLKTLPPNIGNGRSHKVLCLHECESLVELPEGVGNMTALTELCLSGCKTLNYLPPAIGKMVCLRRLYASGCENLVELPNEVGKLVLLKVLDLSGCKNLKKLPSAVENWVCLEMLSLDGCENLVEVLDEVGKLVLLKLLDLKGCKNLKKLPSAVENLGSLVMLRLEGCENVVELLDEVGKLVSLKVLDLSECKNLKKLPSAVENWVSLVFLMLTGCENLVELPDEVGKLVSLKILDLTGCKKLKKLPSAVENLVSLEILSLEGCENLVELPDEVDKMVNLTHLSLFNCKSLNCESLKQPPINFNSNSEIMEAKISKFFDEFFEENEEGF